MINFEPVDIVKRSLLLALIFVALAANAFAQSVTDGATPGALTPGSPAGSYYLSGFDNVNAYNGNLHFNLPLVSVGGRGNARASVGLFIQRRWRVEHAPNPDPYDPNPIDYPTHTDYLYQPYFEPGRIELRTMGNYSPGCSGQIIYGPDAYTETLTRITFTTSDGTEYELRDTATEGRVAANGDCYYLDNYRDRGTVFTSRDGSSLMFVADSPVIDDPYGMTYLSGGYLLFRDGTRYRFDAGRVTSIRDRNGNLITFTYGTDPNNMTTWGRLITIKDSLNRQITFEYDVNDVAPYGLCDRITLKGFGGAARIIRVSRDALSNLLRTTQLGDSPTTKTFYQLFPTLSGSSSVTQNNPTNLFAAVWLPNGQSYKFRYNVYAELARVELPTGGAIEYDYGAGEAGDEPYGGVHGWGPYEIYRRVLTRRVFRENNALEGTTTFSRAVLDQPGSIYDVPRTHVDSVRANASGTVLAKSRHYFYGLALDSLFSAGSYYPATDSWKTGKEYKTDVLTTDGSDGVLRRTESTHQQRAHIPWWSGYSYELEPSNDPRVIEAKTTLTDTNQVSTTTFGYDQYNNETDRYEYDYGSGTAGNLIRRIQTGYVTSSNYTGTGVHLISLPSQVSIFNSANTEQARTSFEYDNYNSDTYHATLTPRPNISGFDAAFSTAYVTRGNVTASTSYFLTNGIVTGSVTSYAQFDIAGNVVKTIDARGYATTVDFSDNFGAPGDTVELGGNPANLPPAELAGLSSFAFPFKVTNALAHTAYSKFDYYLGTSVAAEDANGVIARGYFNDQLDRPTQVIRAANQGASVKSQTTFDYDDLNHVITTTSDQNTFGDNLLKSQTLFDGLGRTTETRQYETTSNFIAVRTVPFVVLQDGTSWLVASQASNPFRPYLGEQPVWTTSFVDSLGRVSKVKTPDNAVVSTAYSGDRVLVTDQAGKQRISRTNALGQLKDVWEVSAADVATETLSFPNHPEVAAGYRTSYTYDTLDSLTTVNQGGQTRTFVYDSLKRLTAATNPESGTVSYQYDNNGNLTQKIDARNITTTYVYDALNRVTSRSYQNDPNGTPAVTYSYDPNILNGKGRLSSISSSVSTYNYTSYDALGRITGANQSIGAQSYPITNIIYDLAGHLKTMTYPSGRSITNTFDSAGRLDTFTGNLGDWTQRTYSTGISYSPFGGMGQEQFGTQTAIFNKRFYNSREQLAEIRAGLTPNDTSWQRGAIINHYSDTCWGMCSGQPMTDNNGNVKKQEHWIQDVNGNVTGIFTQQYEYDQLNRLKRVYDGTNWQQQYTYDRWGNRTIDQTNTWGAGIPKPNFGVDTATNRLTAPAGYTMGYDAAGNLTTDTYTGEGTRSYDAENRMKQAWSSMHWQTYSYDGDGRRVKRIINGTETWQVYGIGGELLAEYAANAAASSPQKEYGYRNGELLVTATSGPACGVGYQGSKSWTATHPSLGHATGQQEGSNWAAYVGTHSPHAMVYGPYDNTFGQGQHQAQFTLMVDNISGSDVVATLDVVTGYGANVLAVRQVRRNEFTAPNQWQTFTVSFNNPCFGLVEGRVWWAGNTNAKFSQMTIGSVSTSTTDVRWLVTDQLGTPRIILDQTGSLATVSRRDYLPFGEELFAGTGGRTTAQGYTASDNVRQKFTSKERDNETGLDYFLARYYSSTQGRFTSPDPLLSSGRSLQPQSWNRYSYVGNAPLNIVDPLGLDWWYKKGEQVGSPEWFDRDPGEGYERWSNAGGYVYQSSTSGLWWALDPYSDNALSFESQEAASQAFDNFSPGGFGITASFGEMEFAQGLAAGLTPLGFINDIVNDANGLDTTSRDYLTGRILGIGISGGLGLAGGVRAVAGAGAGSADEVTTLYRAVSHEEFEQIMRTGTFQAGGNSALFGKYFAESADDAARWGQALEGTKGFRIVDARIPTVEAAKFQRWERLDNIGPARYALFEELRNATIGVVK